MGGTMGLLLITNYELEKSLKENENQKKRKEDNIYRGK